MKPLFSAIIIFGTMLLFSCKSPENSTRNNTKADTSGKAFQRFFNDSSFWNQPIPLNAETDPRNAGWIKLWETEPTGINFKLNCDKWTIPVYEVDSTTPVYKVGLRYLSQEEKIHWHTSKAHFGHGKGFDSIPIPKTASPDPEADSHMAVIDRERKLVWDMWALSKDSAGSWKSATGMVYPLNGPGVFFTEDIGVQDGESVHFYGPSRAAGVPAIAGLIMYDEVMEGAINHKIAAASRFCGFREFVYPAAWTDGFTEGGIPEGATIQLNPNLDLTKFDLTKEEIILCRALQKYGMVLVDIAQGQAIYAEGLWGQPGKSWNGKLREIGGISNIPYKSYRVLKIENSVKKGDGRSKFHDVW
jgi:hypothetical protein